MKMGEGWKKVAAWKGAGPGPEWEEETGSKGVG